MDVGDIVKSVQERVSFVLSADRSVAEIVDILRDTHRILQKMEATIDRLNDTARDVEERFGEVDLSAKRIERLEEAVLNIERATITVESAISTLPRAMQARMIRERRRFESR